MDLAMLAKAILSLIVTHSELLFSFGETVLFFPGKGKLGLLTCP